METATNSQKAKNKNQIVNNECECFKNWNHDKLLFSAKGNLQ